MANPSYPDRESALVALLAELSRDLLADTDEIEMLTRLVDRCVDSLGADSAAVLFPDADGVLSVLAATTSDQAVLENLQLQASEGPCLDCLRTGEPVVVDDLDAVVERWPRWAPAASAAGTSSAYALPMHLHGHVLGTLNIFAEHPKGLSASDRALGQALADVAAAMIATQRRVRHGEEVSAQLQHALDSRVVIEQAKGVVATALGLTMDEAFRLLRDHCRARNRRIAEVSADLAEGRVAADELGTPRTR